MIASMTLAGSVADASSETRALFIRRTYTHLAGAVGIFIALEYLLLGSPVAEILYDTSKIIHSYNPDQHVAAALELFASVALPFWYILRILMRARR